MLQLLFEELLKNYNIKFHEIIKEFEFNIKELYLNFLEIEKDKKEDLLVKFIQGGYDDIQQLKQYKQLYYLYVTYFNKIDITDVEYDFQLEILKNLNIKDIENYCKSDEKLEFFCTNDGWKDILNVKNTQLYKDMLSLSIDYKIVLFPLGVARGR